MTRNIERLAASRRVRVLRCVVRATQAKDDLRAKQIAKDLQLGLATVQADLATLVARGLVNGPSRGFSGYVATAAGLEFQAEFIGYDDTRRTRPTPDVPGLIAGAGSRRDDCALYEDCLTKFCDESPAAKAAQCRNDCAAYRMRPRDELVAAGMLFGRRVGNLEHGEKGESDE